MTATRARQCGSKMRHRTQVTALAHKQRLVDRGTHPDAVQVYRCPLCMAWHVGHARRRKASR